MVAAHVEKKSGGGLFCEPRGAKTRPLIIGELIPGDPVHLFESQWDGFAFLDASGEPSGVIITRGSGNGGLVAGLIPQHSTGGASIAMFGNTNQPIDVIVQSSHLFAPMPEVIREDMAFIDRLHNYIPGWEIPKMRIEFFTDHYGFVVDYLAEALRDCESITSQKRSITNSPWVNI